VRHNVQVCGGDVSWGNLVRERNVSFAADVSSAFMTEALSTGDESRVRTNIIRIRRMVSKAVLKQRSRFEFIVKLQTAKTLFKSFPLTNQKGGAKIKLRVEENIYYISVKYSLRTRYFFVLDRL